MKKIATILLTLLLVFSLVACNQTGLLPVDGHDDPIDNNENPDDPNPISTIDNLDIYYLNDTHGALSASGNQIGLPNIGNLVLTKKEENPDETLFLTGGDILQGNILSNYYDGASTIDLLNDMQLDAFVLGNHEFDWGLETVTKYFRDDVASDVKADFPLLGANVFYDGTTDRPEGVDAYTVIEKGDVKVGVIGVVGEGLENSIATAMVDPYYFDDPGYWTSYYAHYLRTEEDVDIVIAISHGDSNGYNNEVANLTGDYYVDVIFNGHSHQNYIDSVYRNSQTCYIVQSGANGEYVGHVKFDINNKEVTNVSARNLTASTESLLQSANQALQLKLDTYSQSIEALLNETIITAGEYMSKYDLTDFMAKIMRIETNAAIAFHNYGGTRTDLDYHQDITVATLYEIFPFDNVIKTVYLTGREIEDYISSNDGVGYDTEISNFNDDTLYLVATNDYVFDKEYNPFIYGQDIVDTGILLRDLMNEVLTEMSATYDYFYIDNDIQ